MVVLYILYVGCCIYVDNALGHKTDAATAEEQGYKYEKIPQQMPLYLCCDGRIIRCLHYA